MMMDSSKIAEKCEWKKYTTVSIRFYILLIAAAVVLIVLSYMHCPCVSDECNEIQRNIGYGVIASTIVSALLDWQNKKLEYEKIKRFWLYVSAELKEKCLDLTSEVNVAVNEVVNCSIDDKLTFDERVEKLFEVDDQGCSDKQIENIKYFMEAIADIRKSIIRIIEVLKAHDDYENLEEYIEKLEKLNKKCQRAKSIISMKDYSSCKDIILNHIKPQILCLFPDCQENFLKSYNEDDYIE